MARIKLPRPSLQLVTLLAAVLFVVAVATIDALEVAPKLGLSSQRATVTIFVHDVSTSTKARLVSALQEQFAATFSDDQAVVLDLRAKGAVHHLATLRHDGTGRNGAGHNRTGQNGAGQNGVGPSGGEKILAFAERFAASQPAGLVDEQTAVVGELNAHLAMVSRTRQEVSREFDESTERASDLQQLVRLARVQAYRDGAGEDPVRQARRRDLYELLSTRLSAQDRMLAALEASQTGATLLQAQIASARAELDEIRQVTVSTGPLVRDTLLLACARNVVSGPAVLIAVFVTLGLCTAEWAQGMSKWRRPGRLELPLHCVAVPRRDRA